ncbi:Pol, partial [Symbiodinium sp. KB8]
MAADWFDIDYSAFAYDRAFEEDLCIDAFSHDFLAPALGQEPNAWEGYPASEAWNAQALSHQPSTAGQQYAAFFAQSRGAADARVTGDIIDPAEAPITRRAFSLWSGAKRDDRHEHCANLAPQPARKRALQRARRRAIKNGGTWYRAHSLVALNTFGRCDKSAATFLSDATQTQLDFVLTRSLQAGPLGRQAASQPQLAFFQWREGSRHVLVYAVLLDTRPDIPQAVRSTDTALLVDRQHMANEVQKHPEKVQMFRHRVQEALACACHPVSPENLDDILLQASATVFAGKPEAHLPSAWQQPETAIRLQDVWEHRAEHLRLAKQELRRTSRRLRKAKLVQQLENAEQARGRVQLKGEHGEMLTAEAEIDTLHAYWDSIFNDGAQAHDSCLAEGIQVTAQEVLEVVARLPMRKAAMPGRAPCAAWKLAAEDVAPHLHAYVQQAWAPGPVSVPLYLTEAWLHFMSKPGRTLRTPGDLRPLALQTGGGKALSRLLKNQLTPYAERLALHVPQFAYLRNRDAHSAIARALTHIDKALMWAAVPRDLATLLMTWYRSEYALGQRGVDGYTRLDERLSQDWSERHATCFADDFLFQWVLESLRACKAMCTDVGIIFEVFASLGLCINSKKSAMLLKLVGPEAEAWLAKHRVPAPEGVEAKHVLRYDLFRRSAVPIKHTHVYLGIALTYNSYEEASMRRRLRLATIQKHRLARILQGRGGLTKQCRLRLWRVVIATSMLYATHVVGLTRASLRSAHVMMTKHLRAIMRSPRHLTQENDLAFLQRISQDTPLQLVLKAIGSMLYRATAPTDFPCFANEDVMHRLRALWCNMISLSEAPELTMTGAATMAPPVAADKQVQALFGHVLTPMAGGTAVGAKQGGQHQEMDVDSSRKDKEEEHCSDTSERDLVLALGRIVLQQADQLHRLELDTGFFLVLATAPAAGTVIPTMFEVAELWRKKQAETPEQITCSLGVMMLRCLLQELSNRLSHALKSPEVVAALIKQEMLTDKQDWMYMLWDKDNGKLMPDPTRTPLSTNDLQQTFQDAANMLQHHPEVITRYAYRARYVATTGRVWRHK